MCDFCCQEIACTQATHENYKIESSRFTILRVTNTSCLDSKLF